MSAVSDRLPTFPWDKLEPYKATAAAHPDGIVDLSVGTPVDPVPELIQKALIAAADSPGYPTVWGTPELRDAITGWLERRLGAREVTHRHVLPIVGSKELVAWLPTQLGLGPGDRVAYPRLAYPTYEVGARLARAEYVVYDETRPTAATRPGPEAPLAQLAVEPHRQGPVQGRADPDRRLGPRARRPALLRRVLPGAGLGGRPGLGPAPGRERRLLRRDRRRPLALQAVEPRGLPRGVPRRRPGRPGPAPGDPQARRHDDVRAHPGGRGGGPRRRHPRPRAARALRGPPHGPARGPRRPTASASSTARPASTSGRRATSPAGTRWPTWPTSASWWRRATSTARRAKTSYAWP